MVEDSVCYNSDVFMSTYAFSGAEKLVLGTDFPHEIHDLYHAVERIKSLRISKEQKEKILGENAIELLKL